MVSKETDIAEHFYHGEKEAKSEQLARAVLSHNWNSCEQSKKKYFINRQSPWLEPPSFFFFFFAADPITSL